MVKKKKRHPVENVCVAGRMTALYRTNYPKPRPGGLSDSNHNNTANPVWIKIAVSCRKKDRYISCILWVHPLYSDR